MPEAGVRALLESTDAAIWGLDADGCVLWPNGAALALLNRLGAGIAVEGASLQAVLGEADAEVWMDGVAGVLADDEPRRFEVEDSHRDGAIITVGVAIHPMRGRDDAVALFARDISEKVAQEAHSDALNRQMVDASRLAGMAELATNVLHNVGNLLNSVNVTVDVLTSRVRESSLSRLARMLDVLGDEADLDTYLAAKGPTLVRFLDGVGARLAAEQRETLHDLHTLAETVEEMKAIVHLQQSYAIGSMPAEDLRMGELIDSLLRIERSRLARAGIEVVSPSGPVPAARGQRHKVIQILGNLLSNAEDAVAHQATPRVEISACVCDQTLCVDVSDNGVGFPVDRQVQLFQRGYTTKPDGHGFGLHSSSLAAREMGGSLSAWSPGPGDGATFTLRLPLAG